MSFQSTDGQAGAAACGGRTSPAPPASMLIVIVNYRTAGLTIDCLRSLNADTRRPATCRVRVVDNASGDDSVARIRAAIAHEGWGRWASVQPLDRNGGFAFGNNAAIGDALRSQPRPDFVLLLNPDTVVRPGASEALVRFMAAHPRVGIAGSRLEDSDGKKQCSAHRVHSPLSQLLEGARLGLLSRLFAGHVTSPPVRDEPHACDWVSGASMMIRREVFTSIGMFDEAYFLYFEEVDFCCRAKRAGWDVWYVPTSRVVHLEGEATGIRGKQRRAPYWFASRRRFFVKQYGILGLLLADLLWCLGRFTLSVRRLLRLGGRRVAVPERFTRDLLTGDWHALLSRRLHTGSHPEDRHA